MPRFFFFWGKIRHFQQISRWVLPQTFVLCLHRTCTFDTYIPTMLLILPIFFSNFGPEIVQMQAACFEHWSKHNIVFLGWVFGADSHGPQFGQDKCPGFFSDQFSISTTWLLVSRNLELSMHLSFLVPTFELYIRLVFLTFSKKLKPKKTQGSKKLKEISAQNSTKR